MLAVLSLCHCSTFGVALLTLQCGTATALCCGYARGPCYCSVIGAILFCLGCGMALCWDVALLNVQCGKAQWWQQYCGSGTSESGSGNKSGSGNSSKSGSI
jgi:hypothetical protein